MLSTHCKSILAGLTAFVGLCSFSITSEEDLLRAGFTVEDLEVLKADSIVCASRMLSFGVCNATMTVPDDFVFLKSNEARHLLIDLWGNPEESLGDNLVGALIPKGCKFYAQVNTAYVITYEKCGYISDDDAESIDYDELLQRMQDEIEQENENIADEYRKQLKGWAVKPGYDKDTHTLVWAKNFVFGEDDETVNYDMRILGKEGYISINAVVAPEECDEVVSKQSEVVNSLKYKEGYRYSDFDPSTDKISDWTLGGLVAGGLLAKTGLLAKIGIFLAKFWKLILIAFAGIIGSLAKIFRKKKE